MRFEAADRERFESVLRDLRGRGHRIQPVERQGDAHSIWIDPAGDRYLGVADGRRNGRAAGY